MTKLLKFRLCDWMLLAFNAAILASAIQLEVLHSQNVLWVWVHAAVGIIFFLLCTWHIYLHFGNTNWFAKFRQQRNIVTRCLWWSGVLTLGLGIAAFVHWVAVFHHSPLGGIHGKVGFLMIVFASIHIVKRFKFFKPKR